MRDRIEHDPAFGEVRVLAIDPHERWAAKYLLKDTGYDRDKIDFPLLLDPSLTVSAMYGVPFQMNIHVERSTRPATFVIDREGVLRYEHRATSFSDRPTPDRILEVIQEFAEGPGRER